MSGRYSARAVAAWPPRMWVLFHRHGSWHLDWFGMAPPEDEAPAGCSSGPREWAVASGDEDGGPIDHRFAPLPTCGAVCLACLERAADLAERGRPVPAAGGA